MSDISAVEASLPEETGKSHKLVYTVLAVVAIALLIVGLFSYSQERKDKIALEKAGQLTAAFSAAGLPVPTDPTVFTSVFGTDGGAMCEDPGAALNTALHDSSFANGAAAVGMRPILADRRVVEGERIAIGIYCPDQLDEFEEYVQDQKYDDVINE